MIGTGTLWAVLFAVTVSARAADRVPSVQGFDSAGRRQIVVTGSPRADPRVQVLINGPDGRSRLSVGGVELGRDPASLAVPVARARRSAPVPVRRAPAPEEISLELERTR